MHALVKNLFTNDGLGIIKSFAKLEQKKGYINDL